MMRRGKGLFSLFPLPIVPRALSFPFSPVSQRHKEVFAEEGGVRETVDCISEEILACD